MRPQTGGRVWVWRKLPVGLLLAIAAAGCSGPGRASGTPDGPESLSDLPLVLRPSGTRSSIMALVMSGDGNWTPLVRGLVDRLVDRGIPVLGLESRSYLSHTRTPQELADDMAKALRTYRRIWSAPDLLVLGYSRGADFAPFLVNRLSPDLRGRVKAVALLSPTKMASFEFHLLDLVHYVSRDSDLPAVPEVEALAPTPTLCIYGRKDKSALCPDLPEGVAEVVALDTGHRLGDPGKLADLVLDRLQGRMEPDTLQHRSTSSESPPGSRR